MAARLPATALEQIADCYQRNARPPLGGDFIGGRQGVYDLALCELESGSKLADQELEVTVYFDVVPV